MPLVGITKDAVVRSREEVGLRDYAPFDFRVAADGQPKLLEVNPHPAWANNGKLALLAACAGLKYRQVWQMMLEAALARMGRGK